MIYKRKTRPNHKKEILAIKPYLWLLFLSSVYEEVVTGLIRFPAAYFITAYTLFEFLALTYFFYNILNINKKIMGFCISIFVLFFFFSLQYWNLNDYLVLAGYHLALETIIIFTYSFLWFKDLFKKAEVVSLTKSPSFYFIIGNVLYFAGCVFHFLLIDVIYKSSGEISKYWFITLVLGFIMRMLLLIGVLKGTEKK
ncbi:hypothetical protein [Flavobacterium beibuense]|uniref:hypothetical protein n=1 Tax=Flavobacterium beibuense TaxID=657326 RepID=UPI00101D8AB8|nr:hypothetical protein [Flavobacterium beibuense]